MTMMMVMMMTRIVMMMMLMTMMMVMMMMMAGRLEILTPLTFGRIHSCIKQSTKLGFNIS